MATHDSDIPVSKKPKLDNGIHNDLDQEQHVQEAISGIEEIEDKINALEDEQSIEICKLEQKFVQKKNPFYKQRATLIERIPNFWATAFLQHPQLSCLVEESDEDAFQYLREISINQVTKDENITDEEGTSYVKTLNFSITFHFNENPFFDNSEITKSFYQVLDDIISECTEINWHEGKDLVQQKRDELTAALTAAKNGSGDTGEDELDMVESFFSWFMDHQDAANDDTAEIIKDDLYMHALNYFLNEDLVGEEEEEEEEGAEIDLKDSDEDE